MTNPALQSSFASRYQALHRRVAQVCEQVGRDPNSVQILPVSKTFPESAIVPAIEMGQLRFAENRVQELKQKAEYFTAQGVNHLQWVLIGPLQTNKAKYVARFATEIQSLDRWSVVQALDKHLQKNHRTLEALIQVKTSREESKSGMAPEQVLDFLRQLQEVPSLRVKGFMTVAENTSDQTIVRDCFRRLAQLAEQCRQATGLALPELSMGMSADFELAIAEGATQIRVGSALFGARDYANGAANGSH
ncbi:YggS family pyridoxal phosphate-dependent enzyme [Brackiella oedipodis]|uniref:YggS family pyridoxal phosphate-dependent enzyme n=1 Tax=Brackiella oedipodis TaxID=124225 RepID=UPI00048E1E2F|nr:YggS family pyridoxal phosphate-dependent enzyme [Brackiella oedipodis]